MPSLPQSSDGQWRPAVSLGSPESEPISDPSASTAVTPATWDRIVPNRTTREPPALVATAPPTVAVSRLAKSTGASSPAAWACRRQPARVTPAPTLTCIAPGSTGSIWSRRRVDSTTMAVCRGTPPPTRPVLPPCGTTAAPESAQRPTTAATCWASAGRATSKASPRNRPVQSVAYDAVTSGSVSTCSSPTISAMAPASASPGGGISAT